MPFGDTNSQPTGNTIKQTTRIIVDLHAFDPECDDMDPIDMGISVPEHSYEPTPSPPTSRDASGPRTQFRTMHNDTDGEVEAIPEDASHGNAQAEAD